jgi:hypothetical protein
MQKMRSKRKLISGAVEEWGYLTGIEMSLRLGLKSLSGMQEILVLALMLVSVFAIFYSDMEFTYKIGIAVLVFTVIFLTSLANQVLKQEKEKSQLRTSAQKNYSPLI